ncbi:MAG: hypothetical protein ACKOWF_06870, partial [Chloroflexota bacterium]
MAFAMLLAMVPAAVVAQETPTPIASRDVVLDVSSLQGSRSVTLDGPAVAPAICSQAAENPEVAPPLYDYLILVDVSRSMRGIRGLNDEDYVENLDIWDEVVQSVTQFVSELDDQASVYIVPFAGGLVGSDGELFDPSSPAFAPEAVQTFTPFYMSEPGDRDAAIAFVGSLYADYEGTHLARSVEYSLRLMASLKAEDAGPRDHVQTLLIYSDGIGNGPGDPAYLGENPENYPSLPEILRQYLDLQNYIFTKYIMLSEAANGLEPGLVDELIGVGVSIVSGEVPKIREVRLAVEPAELGTLDVDDRASTRLCLLAGTVGVGVELRLSDDQSLLPEDVTLRLSPPDGVILGPGEAGIAVGWRLVEKPEQSQDESYFAKLIVDPVDPEVIPVPGQFSLPFRIKGYPDGSIQVEQPQPIDARRSAAGSGDGRRAAARISLGEPLPEGATLALSLLEADAHGGIVAGFAPGPGSYGDPSDRERVLEAGDDEAYLVLDLPDGALVETPDGAPREDGTYTLRYTVEAVAEGIRLAGQEPGQPVALQVEQEVLVIPGGALVGCEATEADAGETVAEGANGEQIPVCLTVAFSLGGDEPGVRAEHALEPVLSGSAAVELRIGDRDGTDLFPNAVAGFAAPRGRYGDPALGQTAVLDAGSNPIAVGLDVPAEDLRQLAPGAYPLVIDVIVDPLGVDLDLSGPNVARNADGTWTVRAGATLNVTARPILEVGPAPPVAGDPPEFVIGERPDRPVRWEVEVPYLPGEGIQGSLLRLDGSELPPGMGVRLMGGMRERTEVTLDKPGLSIGVTAEGDPALLEQLGSGQHAMRAYLVIDPGNAEVAGPGVLDNGDGTYALPIELTLTLIDPAIVRCDLPAFDSVGLADRGPDESVTWSSP